MHSYKINNHNFNIYYYIGITILSIFVYFRILHNVVIEIGEPSKFINIFDGPSYFDFSFENLEIILSQHRSFGFPLFMKLYRFFDYDLSYWSLVSYVFYIFQFSIFFIQHQILI